MGDRGPIGKSQVVRIREGSSPPPKPPPGALESAFEPLKRPPKAPTWLAAHGKALWKRLAPRLVTARLLMAENLPSLEALCSIYATARQADAILQRDGLTMTVGENGYRQQRPEVSISHRHWRSIDNTPTPLGSPRPARGGSAWRCCSMMATTRSRT